LSFGFRFNEENGEFKKLNHTRTAQLAPGRPSINIRQNIHVDAAICTSLSTRMYQIIATMIKFLLGALLLATSFSVSYSFPVTNALHRSSLTITKMSSTESSVVDVSRFMTGDRPEGTKDYIMQQIMIRVKDPIKSLEFYCDVLGFRLIMYREFPQWGFNVYFVAPANAEDIPEGPEAQWDYCMKTPGTIEITWNYGTESDQGLVYNTGNADSTGTEDGQKVKVRLFVNVERTRFVSEIAVQCANTILRPLGWIWSSRYYRPRCLRSLRAFQKPWLRLPQDTKFRRYEGFGICKRPGWISRGGVTAGSIRHQKYRLRWNCSR
jgi:lactoylglutathione lyase